MLVAADVMSSDVITVHRSAPLATISSFLERMHVRYLPVVDDDGRVVAVISDREIHRAQGHADRVADAVSGELCCAGPADDLLDVVRLMIEHKVGAVPIVEPGGRAIGIVTYVDALRAMADDPGDEEPALEVIDLPRTRRRRARRERRLLRRDTDPERRSS